MSLGYTGGFTVISIKVISKTKLMPGGATESILKEKLLTDLLSRTYLKDKWGNEATQKLAKG